MLVVSKNTFTDGKIHYRRLQQHNFVGRQGLTNQRKSYRLFRGYLSHLPASKKKLDEATCSSAKTFDKQDFTFQQALSSKEGDLWRTAIHDEYAPLMKNKTWEFSNHVMEEHQSNVDGYLTLRPDMNEFRNAIRPAQSPLAVLNNWVLFLIKTSYDHSIRPITYCHPHPHLKPTQTKLGTMPEALQQMKSSNDGSGARCKSKKKMPNSPSHLFQKRQNMSRSPIDRSLSLAVSRLNYPFLEKIGSFFLNEHFHFDESELLKMPVTSLYDPSHCC